jgi:hypothetical protein
MFETIIASIGYAGGVVADTHGSTSAEPERLATMSFRSSKARLKNRARSYLVAPLFAGWP